MAMDTENHFNDMTHFITVDLVLMYKSYKIETIS